MGGVVLLLAVGLVACRAPRPSGPDLLLVTVDTLRADALECYGGKPDVGNAICDLASHGVRYAWAFSTAPSTSPAVASVLTGVYPHEHAVQQFATSRLAEDEITVAERLHSAGYATAAFVSNPVLMKGRQMDQGFDVYDDHMTSPERHRQLNIERVAEDTTDAVLRWLETAPSPWFLWVHYQDPHGPYEAPDAPPPQDEPGGHILGRLHDESGKGGIPVYQQIPGVITLEAYRKAYRNEIRYADRHIARLLQAVEGRGRPVGILLTADHGEAFGEDGYFLAHGHSLGLGQIRVPLLWRPPGGVPPVVLRAPVSILDVAPTLLAAVGLPVPDTLRGRPLPVRSSEQDPQRVIFAEQRLRTAVVSGDLYYARDREPIVAPVQDRISGGVVRALPPRTALLGDSDALPPYRPAHDEGASEALEPLLSEFIEAGPAAPEPPPAELPAEVKTRLEALGYLE